MGGGGEFWIPVGEDEVVFSYSAEEGGDEFIGEGDAYAGEWDEEDGYEVGE